MAKKSKGFSELLKQEQREKMQRQAMQEMEDDIRQGPLKEEFVDILQEPKGHARMSDVLSAFVEPYEDKEEEMSLNQRQSLLGIAVIAWNLALLPKDQRKAALKEIIRELLKGEDPLFQREMREIINEMVARKDQFFADNQRYIVNYQLRDLGTEFHLTVASTVPGEPVEE